MVKTPSTGLAHTVPLLDMDLYVWKEGPEGPEPNYSLIDDTSRWSNEWAISSAVSRDDPVDGIGKEIQFSYYWDAVSASTEQSDHAGADVNWDRLTQLNFDFNVRGAWPEYGDDWKATVAFLDYNGNTLCSDSREGRGT